MGSNSLRNIMFTVMTWFCLVTWAIPAVSKPTQDVKKIKKNDMKEDVGKLSCSDFFAKHRKCPQDYCRIGCFGGGFSEGCPLVCEPLPCFEIEPEYCPKEECQILKGCNGKDVCYTKFDETGLTCGDVSYSGQTLECCEGLTKRCGIEFLGGECDMEGSYTMESVSMCIPCGNGICNQFENACNCPEDCSIDN